MNERQTISEIVSDNARRITPGGPSMLDFIFKPFCHFAMEVTSRSWIAVAYKICTRVFMHRWMS
jgi:hypothetical protein